MRTAKVSSAAIAAIAAARKAGHSLTFTPDGKAKDSDYGVVVATYFVPGRFPTYVQICANGVLIKEDSVGDDFTGEEDGMEAAIERSNDEWSRSDGSDGIWR